MKKIDIVVTMGGRGERFRKAGYEVPKYMIEVKGKTLFEWSMDSLRCFDHITEQYIFIVMSDKKVDVEAFIKQKCEKRKIWKYKIILIDYLTEGQAATAMLAKECWNEGNGLLIYNIDTYVEKGAMCEEEIRGDGFIPCFRAEGEHWSFVRLDEKGKVAELREKERISEYCTIGAYYFRSCALYEELYRGYYGGNENGRKENLVNGEKYVAPLYNLLLEKGGEVYISDIDCSLVHVLGTPEELEVFAELG